MAAPSYGSFRLQPRPLAGRGTPAAVAAGATVLAIAALLAVVSQQTQGPAVLLGNDIAHWGWQGCGPGGNCGPSYHWTSEAFSPIQGRSTYIRMTHNHDGWGNYVNNETKQWVVGAHVEYPYTETAPAEFDLSTMPLAGMAVNPDDLEDPMEYFGKMFPVEKGYSASIMPTEPMEITSTSFAYSGAKEEGDEDEDKEDEDKEEGDDKEEGGDDKEDGGDEEGDDKKEEGDDKEEEEGDDKEEGEEEEAAERPHGEANPMVFGDLNQVDGHRGLQLSQTNGYVPWWERIGLKFNQRN